MQALSPNLFKRALQQGQTQIGLWVGLADDNVAEALAGCGFDWLLLDAEHGPNDVRTVLSQLRAVAPYPVHPVVRPVEGRVALVKQYLDVGAQTLLVPMIDNAGQAREMVRAMRYAPVGVRGMGAALARASRWNQVPQYVQYADDEMCLLVQAETVRAMNNLDAIASVEGVDGVFFGPADLSASMGLRGQPNHRDVKGFITQGIHAVRAAGKAAGVLATDPVVAREYLEAGALFVAVGVDTTLLVQRATALRRDFKPDAQPVPTSRSSAY